MAVLIMALSLAMTARSSPAVLHALTFRMRSRNLRDMLWMVSVMCLVPSNDPTAVAQRTSDLLLLSIVPNDARSD
eukprot:scaffold10291_cov293-Chaetoceros_neogracile.AAC.15